MQICALAFTLISLMWTALILFLAFRYRARLHTAAPEPPSSFTPRAAVILPCKGLDPELESSLLALLQQDYPDYELILVTEAADDAAYPLLCRLAARYPERAQVVVAGPAMQRSQKVHNQLAALQAVDPQAEVLAFVDSDGCPDLSFIRSLIGPLSDPALGASTGFRWFTPRRRGLLASVLVLWGAIQAAVQAEPLFAQVWGGAMAMRRRLFDELGVGEAWAGASTDDDSLSRLLNAHKLRVACAPLCFALTPVDYSFRQFMDWGTRQFLLTRVYLPLVWWQLLAFVSAGAFGPSIALGMTIAGLLGAPLLAPGLVVLGASLAAMLARVVVVRATEQMLARLGRNARRLAWSAFPAVFLGDMLIFAQFVRSGITRRVVWRGVAYELLGPDRTVVRREA